MDWSPGGAAPEPAAVPQEEFRESVARGPLSAFGVVACPFGIADGLGVRVLDVDGREVSGAKLLCKLLRAAAVGLAPRAGLNGDERGGDDLTGDSGLVEPAGQAQSGGPGLVAAAQRLGRPEP